MNATVGYVPVFLTNFRNVRLHTSPLQYIIRVLYQALKEKKKRIRLQEYDVMMRGGVRRKGEGDGEEEGEGGEEGCGERRKRLHLHLEGYGEEEGEGGEAGCGDLRKRLHLHLEGQGAGEGEGHLDGEGPVVSYLPPYSRVAR